ncbi:hypothetical protein QYF36_000305 [Acer negundo]|nr:hypothetical protein QYF36_000305 [Acer negundo]
MFGPFGYLLPHRWVEALYVQISTSKRSTKIKYWSRKNLAQQQTITDLKNTKRSRPTTYRLAEEQSAPPGTIFPSKRSKNFLQQINKTTADMLLRVAYAFLLDKRHSYARICYSHERSCKSLRRDATDVPALSKSTECDCPGTKSF